MKGTSYKRSYRLQLKFLCKIVHETRNVILLILRDLGFCIRNEGSWEVNRRLNQRKKSTELQKAEIDC